MSSNDRQYALSWSNYTSHLKNAFDSLLTGNEFVDVTLSCEGRKISAHKMLLSACSTYFHDLFRDNPCQHPIVIFRDVQFQDLKYLLTFMYSGEVSVPTENLDSFLKTAESLHISGLNSEQNRRAGTDDGTDLSQHMRSVLKRYTEIAQGRTEMSTDGRDDDANLSEENVNKKLKLEIDSTGIKQEEVEILNPELDEFPVDDPLRIDSMDPLQPSGSQRLEEVQDSLNDTMDGIDEMEMAETSSDKLDSLLSKKSRKIYEAMYNQFMEWRSKQSVTSFSEQIMLTYFTSLSTKYKSSTLWTHYSMLRCTLRIHHNVKIEDYHKLKSFLKRKWQSHQPKRSKILSPKQINTFITKAPDKKYLATKVALIMGIMGACNAQELHAMQINDLEDLNTALVISVPNSKTNVTRKFTITGQFYNICQTYINLRHPKVSPAALFLVYQNGLCCFQRMGINKFGVMAKEVARYLELPNPELYTGHCFRKSSLVRVKALRSMEEYLLDESNQCDDSS